MTYYVSSGTLNPTHSLTSPRLTLFLPLPLTSTLPGPSASEVTTIRRYTNVYIIIFWIPRDLETEKLEIEDVRSDA